VCRLKRFAPSEQVRAGPKTPTADHDAGRLIRSLSTKSPMRKSRTIVITANLTPRKCLGFKTPFQALKELGKDVQIRFA
jgi:hypothetical protein